MVKPPVLSRAQIRPRRAKRPSRAPCDAQIRSRGIKRRLHDLQAFFSTAQSNPCWGSKRVRTALSSVPPLVLFVRPTALHPDNLGRDYSLRSQSDALGSWGSKRRRSDWDWSNLGGGDGPLGLIAELVLSNDVADYVRFRAVCRPWRRCAVDPRSLSGLDGRFLPRQLIMLDKAHVAPRCRHRFLNVSTGECIRTELPELAEHRLLALTPEGLLLLVHEPTLVLRLLHPLTRQLTDLPPAIALLTAHEQRDWRSGDELGEDTFWVCGVGLADASTVAVSFSRPRRVTVVAKPGDECWTVVDSGYIDSALPFAGRFYCAVGSCIKVLNKSDQGPPQLMTVVQRSKPLIFSRMSGSIHLVDNGGELMLVHRMLRQSNDAQGSTEYKMEYEVYRVDFEARDLILVKGLCGRAVFMGRRRAVSVPVEFFPSVSADTLYIGFDCREKTEMNKIDGYNVADGSSEPCHHQSHVHPYSFVDCLSRCIQGTGKHLA